MSVRRVGTVAWTTLQKDGPVYTIEYVKLVVSSILYRVIVQSNDKESYAEHVSCVQSVSMHKYMCYAVFIESGFHQNSVVCCVHPVFNRVFIPLV